MAYTIKLCPYCGGDISADESSYYVCQECGKRIFRSRTNVKAFLLNKPYEEEYSELLDNVRDPEESLSKIKDIMAAANEPDCDMYFTRGLIYTELGEEGKAHSDWKKGLELMTDLRFIDAYIVAVCRRIADVICMKEREFIEFNPIEYIDAISTEFSVKAEVPTRGMFYVTIFRNFRMKLQAGELDDDFDIYSSITAKMASKILSYTRDYRVVMDVVEELFEDFHYNPETYEEDDNLRLHLCEMLVASYQEIAKNFSDEHIVRILRHWNDENMYELEYWMDELMKSARTNSPLRRLRSLVGSENDNIDLSEGVDEFARKYLLVSDEGEDLSQEP